MINLATDQRIELLGMGEGELREFMAGLGEKPFRARQLYDAIYRRRMTDFESMTDLPKTLRRILEERAVVTRTRIDSLFLSSDGTRRFLLKLGDGREVEAVFMPEDRRDTICISSQVGCPLACDFCMTGVIGLKRNMTAGEIVSQIVLVLNQVYGAGGENLAVAGRVNPDKDLWDERRLRKFHTNIVMMGMGEPLLNYDSVMKSVRLFADDGGLAITPRRVTLSTAGIVPRIYDLASEDIRPRLAISLTAANDELRDRDRKSVV